VEHLLTESFRPAHGLARWSPVELTRRLKLPHIRRHLLELVPTVHAQRGDHAALVRVLLAEEAAGRDATNLRTRRARAGSPPGRPCMTGAPRPRPSRGRPLKLRITTAESAAEVGGPGGSGQRWRARLERSSPRGRKAPKLLARAS
jgi:hypothetical protein